MGTKPYFWPPENDGTQTEMYEDPRWEGVPPVGDRPISKMKFPFLPVYGKWAFLLLLLLVFVVKIIIWSIYRYMTGNLAIFTDPESGKETVYWAGMVAKPILQLGPVVILWIFIFKEKGIPFRFTRKNLFSSVTWGCIGGLIFFIVASFVYVIHMWISGRGTDFSVVAGWNAEGIGWGLVIATMFSYMIGTGPTEEIFSRGFLQDQAGRVWPVAGAIVVTAILFAIGHLPVSIFLYHLHETREGLVLLAWYMVILFIMGCFFSIIYHWSRNIVLGIIIHGLWDVHHINDRGLDIRVRLSGLREHFDHPRHHVAHLLFPL
jgi:membrane protease YdiL (CAAX protease family)